jgi:hypothetical protein
MGNPGAVQRLFDAAVTRLDHVSRHGADKGIERLGANDVHHALTHPHRVETDGNEGFGRRRLIAGTNLWTAQPNDPTGCGRRSDVCDDRARTKAPAIASLKPSPETVSTPVLGEAATTS